MQRFVKCTNSWQRVPFVSGHIPAIAALHWHFAIWRVWDYVAILAAKLQMFRLFVCRCLDFGQLLGDSAPRWVGSSTLVHGMIIKAGCENTLQHLKYLYIPYHTLPLGPHTTPYHTITYLTIQHHTIPHHAAPYHTLPMHWTRHIAMVSHHTAFHYIKSCHTIPLKYTILYLSIPSYTANLSYHTNPYQTHNNPYQSIPSE